MRLPSAENAIIAPQKLRDYILAPNHPKGMHKAHVFARAGYRRDNWIRLFDDLRELARTGDAQELDRGQFGRKFGVHGILQGPDATLDVMAIWIIRHGEELPRFVTAHPGRSR